MLAVVPPNVYPISSNYSRQLCSSSPFCSCPLLFSTQFTIEFSNSQIYPFCKSIFECIPSSDRHYHQLFDNIQLVNWYRIVSFYKNFGWIQLLLFKSFSSRLSRFYWLVIYHDRNRSNASTAKYWRKLLVIGDKYFWVIRQKMFENSFESFKSLSKLFQWTQCAIYSALRITTIEKPKAGHLMT